MVANFSGGPGAFPLKVTQQARDALENVDGVGLPILGISHRSDWFRAIVDEAERNVRQLLDIPDGYHVLFLQGGSSLQFSMIPMNFLAPGRVAAYVQSGYWSAKAIPEATYFGEVDTIWDGSASGYRTLPTNGELVLPKHAAYLHYVANETVEGIEFGYIPDTNSVPLICDMSSNLMASPLDVSKFDMVYAHAQKNLGPAGVTIVVVKDELVKSGKKDLPAYLRYQPHIDAGSIYNTPPVFSIYVLLLVTRWMLDDVGGLANMAKANCCKSATVYDAIDSSNGFYVGHADKTARSVMNVSFTLKDTGLQQKFLAQATEASLVGLDGHRSLGGVRASLYNAVTEHEASALARFMHEFAARH